MLENHVRRENNFLFVHANKITNEEKMKIILKMNDYRMQMQICSSTQNHVII
jgi:hypothetical protein